LQVNLGFFVDIGRKASLRLLVLATNNFDFTTLNKTCEHISFSLEYLADFVISTFDVHVWLQVFLDIQCGNLGSE